MNTSKVVICPYCGETQPAGEVCRACRGRFDSLSRQATHNEMGPWFIRDPKRPFQPGCSYETLVRMVERGQVTKFSIIRGPTTRQFWTVARRVPGISHLLGYCHHCDASVDPDDHGCHACGVPFGAYLDRNYMGLPEIRPMPWDPDSDESRGESLPRALPPESGPSRTFRPAEPRTQRPEPGGLSSFATNAELFGDDSTNGTSHHSTDPASQAPSSSAAAVAPAEPQAQTAQPQANPASRAESDAESSSTNSTRRAVLIFLGMIAAAVAVAAMASVIWWFA